MQNYYFWDDPFSYTTETFDCYSYFQDNVMVQQIYESHLFVLGRYT